MKTKNIRLSIFLLSTMALVASCSDFKYNEVLENSIDETWSAERLTTDVEESLYAAYSVLPKGYTDLIGYQDCVTDNAATNSTSATKYDLFNSGVYTESNNPDDVWASSYNGIYLCNRYLVRSADYITNVLSTSEYVLEADLDTYIAMVNTFQAEAMTLKAFFYVELIRRYGLVPIITESDATNDPSDSSINDISIPSLSELVSYVAGLCDSAYDDLETSHTASSDQGRVTKAVAMAIKSRLYLYAAAMTTDNSTYLDACIDVSLELIGLSGSELDSFSSLFDVSNSTHTSNTNEVLFERRYTTVNTIATANYPIGFEAAMGNTNPSHNLVEAFYKSYMGDMSADFEPSAAAYADLANDERFSATIIYDGVSFNSREIETFEGGADATQSPITPGSKTGYYLAKYMHSAAGNLVTGTTTTQNWFFMRYAEVYFNLAEALYYRYGDDAYATAGVSSLDVLNVVRAVRGADLISSTLTGSDYLAFLQNERRVEFAFEGMYYFDIKRWSKMGLYSLSTDDTTIKEVVIGVSRSSYAESTVSDETRYGSLEDYPLPATETLNDFL